MFRIVVSGITDIRATERLLKAHDVAYEIDEQSMANSQAREAFRDMKAEHQWPSLPMIFADDRFIGGEPELRVFLDAQHPAKAPLARWLGIGGLIPFFALAAAAVFDIGVAGIAPAPALLAYAATILSFVGAVHWGMAVADGHDTDSRMLFAASVVPALIAWLALLLPANAAIATFLVGFTGWYGWERLTVWYLYPGWFRALRTLLTTLVCLTLLIVASFA